MKTVGLKIEKGLVAAAVIAKRFGRIEIIDSFRREFATDAELAELLMHRAKEWIGCRIVSSIPGRHFTQRLIRFPFDDRRKIEKALVFELEDAMPFPIDDVVIDHIIISDGRKKGKPAREATILAVVIHKSVLRRHLELLASAGIEPQVIVPSFAGLHRIAAMMKTDGRVAILSGSDLCVKDGDEVVALRYVLTSSAGGIIHTLKAVETVYGSGIERILLLDGRWGEPLHLEDMGVSIETALPEVGGKKPDDPVSLGLALVEHLNFRKGEFAFRRANEAGLRKKRALLIAAGVAALLGLVNMGVKYSMVHSAHARLEKEMREIYHRTFPESRAKGDPLKLMRAGIEEMNRKAGALGTGASALDVMRQVTDGVPREVRVSFQEFNLEADRLRLQGEAVTFEAVDRIKAELQKSGLFSEVTVADTRMGVDNKVKFRIDIKLREAM